MINLIGAYVVGIMALALWRSPLPLGKWNEQLRSGSVVPHLLIVVATGWLFARLLSPDLDRALPLLWIPGHLFDTANLFIHEAGHGVLFWAPGLVMSAGGTVLQVGLPVVMLLVMLHRGYYCLVPLVLFWIGANLVNVGIYVADARARQLPLFGGDSVSHDWTTLLTAAGLLPYDEQIGGLVWWCGIVLAGGAMVGQVAVLCRLKGWLSISSGR